MLVSGAFCKVPAPCIGNAHEAGWDLAAGPMALLHDAKGWGFGPVNKAMTQSDRANTIRELQEEGLHIFSSEPESPVAIDGIVLEESVRNEDWVSLFPPQKLLSALMRSVSFPHGYLHMVTDVSVIRFRRSSHLRSYSFVVSHYFMYPIGIFTFPV